MQSLKTLEYGKMLAGINMKNTVITIFFLLLFSIISFAQSDDSQIRCGLPFSSYSFKISWNDERAVLYDFAYNLKEEPELIGYIFIMTNEGETIDKARLRADKITKFLTKNSEKKLRIEKSRLVINYRQTLNESEIILQPVTKGFPAPNF